MHQIQDLRLIRSVDDFVFLFATVVEFDLRPGRDLLDDVFLALSLFAFILGGDLLVGESLLGFAWRVALEAVVILCQVFRGSRIDCGGRNGREQENNG